jgi:hypothetical protein
MPTRSAYWLPVGPVVLPLARLPGVCGPLVPGGLVELLVPPGPTAPPTLLPEEPRVLGGKVSPEVVPGFVAALGVPSVPDGPVEVLVPLPGEAGIVVCAQAEPPASRARTVATERIVFIRFLSSDTWSRLWQQPRLHRGSR